MTSSLDYMPLYNQPQQMPYEEDYNYGYNNTNNPNTNHYNNYNLNDNSMGMYVQASDPLQNRVLTGNDSSTNVMQLQRVHSAGYITESLNQQQERTTFIPSSSQGFPNQLNRVQSSRVNMSQMQGISYGLPLNTEIRYISTISSNSRTNSYSSYTSSTPEHVVIQPQMQQHHHHQRQQMIPQQQHQKLQLIQQLVQGNNYIIWRAKYCDELAYVKTSVDQDIDAEFKVLKKIQGKGVVQVLSVEKDYNALIMRHYSYTLKSTIPKENGMKDRDMFLSFLTAIVSAASRVHGFNIVHTDVRPENLLIDDVTGEIVFSDFSHAVDLSLHNNQLLVDEQTKILNEKKKTRGSPLYHAIPDVWGNKFSIKSDVWSIAQIAYEMWTGTPPQSNPTDLPYDIPCRDILSKCLRWEASKRPSLSDIVMNIQTISSSH